MDKFRSKVLVAVFQSYHDDRWVIKTDCKQWISVYD